MSEAQIGHWQGLSVNLEELVDQLEGNDDPAVQQLLALCGNVLGEFVPARWFEQMWEELIDLALQLGVRADTPEHDLKEAILKQAKAREERISHLEHRVAQLHTEKRQLEAMIRP